MPPFCQQKYQNVLHFSWFSLLSYNSDFHWLLPLLGSDRLKFLCLFNFSCQYRATLLNCGILDTSRWKWASLSPMTNIWHTDPGIPMAQDRALRRPGVEILKYLVLGEWDHWTQNPRKPAQMEETTDFRRRSQRKPEWTRQDNLYLHRHQPEKTRHWIS